MIRKHRDFFLLASRLIIGGIFIVMGWMKISDMAMTIGYFGSMGISPFWTYVTAYTEFLGGICVVLGLYIELAATLLSIVMLVAVYVLRGQGFLGFMPPLGILAGLLALLAEAGKYAMGSNLHKRRRMPEQAM